MVRIHVNMHVIRRNHKTGERQPPITVIRGSKRERGHAVDILGHARIVVLDGQQRLTSLYIGLKGTYAYKMPRLWWEDSERVLPTRQPTKFELIINCGTSSETRSF